jgi:Fur family zinc uptake transcriptional regulator
MHVEPVLTANQQLVFKALGDAEAPLSAYTILERLQGKGIKAPLQVYRALEKLIDFGLVHRLESLSAFVVCDHHGDHTQHPVAFAICDSCGLVAEFVDSSVQEGLTRWTTGHAFRPKRVTVELRGLCETCDGASK